MKRTLIIFLIVAILAASIAACRIGGGGGEPTPTPKVFCAKWSDGTTRCWNLQPDPSAFPTLAKFTPAP